MTHVWQTQTRGEWYLLLHRHPFCRYDYSLKPGWPLERYGIEQQAEIVRHAFLLRRGVRLAGNCRPGGLRPAGRFPRRGIDRQREDEIMPHEVDHHAILDRLAATRGGVRNAFAAIDRRAPRTW